MIYSDQVFKLEPTLISSPYSTEPVEDWSNPKRVLIEAPVSVQPLSSVEQWNGLDVNFTQEGWRMISAPGHILDDLTASSRVYVEGIEDELEVDGPPQHWRGILPHTEVRLKRYEGYGQ